MSTDPVVREDEIAPIANGIANQDSHGHSMKAPSVHHDDLLERRDDHPERVLIANPLRVRTKEEVKIKAINFRRNHGLRDIVDRDVFVRAALAAQNPDAIRDIPGITRLEIRSLERERDSEFWGQMRDLTREFIQILATCCIAAIVQGWDQSSINGANLKWPDEFGIPIEPNNINFRWHNVWIFAIVNAASYFSAALIGSQLSDPLNEYAFGRRGALFIAACFSFSTVIAAAYVESWEALLGMRILLGIGIGAKASVVAIYIAETCPTKLRGSLIIFWQMFVACGIFLGDAANLVVFESWRKQVASPFIPAIPLMVLVFFCYESPRWLYKHNKVKEALISLRHLRDTDILACRDLFLMHEQLQGEVQYFLRKGDREHSASSEPPTSAQAMLDTTGGESDDEEEAEEEQQYSSHDDQRTPTWGSRIREIKNIYMPKEQAKKIKPMEEYHIEIRNTTYVQRVRQLFVRPHIRATTAATCVMAAQQLCGVNILAFLSTTIFSDAFNKDQIKNDDDLASAQKKALWMSFGFGVSNFIFTFLAWRTIDRKGRRWLLNLSFPGMAIALLGMGLCFLIKDGNGKVGGIVTFAILFAIAYAPGVGPVPFTASAEMFPLFIREVGMSFAVFVNLLGAGIIALVTPTLAHRISPQGLLWLFVGLDLIAWLLCYMFYPETARISLEELRAVFDVPLEAQARYRLLYLRCIFEHYITSRWTGVEVEFPDPIHVWWRDQPKTHQEKQDQAQAHRAEKRAAKARYQQEKKQLRHAKRVHTPSEEAQYVEERRTLETELEQARQREAEYLRQIEHLKTARQQGRAIGTADVESDESSDSSSH